jgi:hypothetical protein
MQLILSPQTFVAKSHHTTLKERSTVQPHFIDPCRPAGHPTPAQSNTHGGRFAFAAGAAWLEVERKEVT